MESMQNLPSFLSLKPLEFGHAFLLLVLFSLTFIIKLIKPEKPSKQKLPPGPKPWPIVGNLPEMLANKPACKWIHNMMNEMNTEITCIRLGNVHVIPVTSPDLAREFLKKQDFVFASRPLSMSTDVISYGYLTTILVPFGDQWKKMRKIITSDLLSAQKLQWLCHKRIEEADNLIRYVYNHSKMNKNGLVNVRIAARHYCGNVIRKLIFSRRYFGKIRKDGGPNFEEMEHVDAIFMLLKYIYAFCVSDFLPWLRGFDLDGHEKIVKKALLILSKYHDPLIEERIEQWKDGRKKDVEDWLDVLITLKDANMKPLLTFEEIKAQIIELMIATIDNPSNAAEWAMAEMLNKPELLQKATEELDSVVGNQRLVQESDLPKLNYIKACAREAFRRHPIMAFNPPHIAMADTVVSGYFIPKGSHVVLSRQGLGRNPRVWSEPMEFKPERHFKSDGSEVILAEHDLNFISFSTGRRGCPGISLGSSMTVMLFARLIQGFSWSLPPNEARIDLSESDHEKFLAKPLLAVAKPRLAEEVYITD